MDQWIYCHKEDVSEEEVSIAGDVEEGESMASLFSCLLSF